MVEEDSLVRGAKGLMSSVLLLLSHGLAAEPFFLLLLLRKSLAGVVRPFLLLLTVSLARTV
jgi:hypothetical protein